jgi:hypoxanthine phosphoribosyltransferase
MQTIRILDKTFKMFITREQIQDRLREVGQELTAKFADSGKKPIFISILNGSFVWMADLVRACDFDCELAFIKISSYEKTQSTGKVKFIMGLDMDIKGYDVIVVEDIVDTGNTLKEFLPDLESKGPASITVVTLLFKPESLQHPIPVDYVAFEIPPKFVVGYGLDYDGLGRTLPDIWQLAD